MATAEERMQILRMIEEGAISAADGAELLRALDGGEDGPRPPLRGASEPRWFRVRITDMTSGQNKVNVNIPMGLVHVGLKMGARFAPDVDGFDYPSLLEAIKRGEQGKVVDFVNNEEGERVEIFVE